ncbi:MAG: hypothetical protein JWM11_7158 [Planctomycetaceae bacterium]|nr:hypothetical protein [Planctomycetaceae bacterium]
MWIENTIWRRISAGIIGTVAACSLAGTQLAADDSADRPPGSRQFDFRGKTWPPYSRPRGKEPTFIQQYHYTHYWPYPHNCEDRSAVNNALNIQAANGWVEATTLFSYHFDPETEQLNSSGMAHLEYILYRVPYQRRSVFIQVSPSPQTDQARLASVQNSMGTMLQSNSLPPIAMRRARAYGTSAEEVDIITRKYIGGAPTPRLSVSGGGSSSPAAGAGPKSSSND